MNQNTVRVVAAVVDTAHLTLYKENGETITIPQGDSRLRRIVEDATPGLVQHGYADVDLSQENPFKKFEDQSGGGIKLFRVAKDKLKKLFGFGSEKESPSSEVSPLGDMTLGCVPNTEKVKQTQDAVAEILSHAVPVNSHEFDETNVAQQGNIVEENGETKSRDDAETAHAPETIVAVVEGKIIPGMEKIKTQFHRATASGSPEGMDNFLRRLGGVIEDRSHSVEDLLKFLERGDLPIADDGSILIYKVLQKRGDKYVDCHTSKVEQWVGAFVCMDPSLVDRNRNNECSNGLHVARRGYVKGFSGDVCVLAKLAPEDVIAVPAYDANKMRVCGYHIISELTKEQYNLLKRNRPITDDEDGKKLLADALRGNHIHRTHEVRITQHMGNAVVVKELGKEVDPVPVKTSPVKEEIALNNPGEAVSPPVCPKEVVSVVSQLSRKEQAKQLYEAGDMEKLRAFKKAAKVSWDKLGIPDPDKEPPVPVVKPKSTPAKAKKAKGVTDKRTVNDVALGEGSPRERIQKLLAIGLTSVGVAKAILGLKKKSKKSWDALGVTKVQADQITKLIN